MEDNTQNPSPAEAPAKSEAIENIENFRDGGMPSNSDLGWVAIMMLGLTGASLIYSIFYYKKRLENLKRFDDTLISGIKNDIEQMKGKIDSLTGKRVRNGRLA